MARRVLANHRRGELRRQALAERLSATLNDVSLDHYVDGELAAALARLSEEDRELLRLVAWDELTPKEISVVLGLAQVTVRVRLHRARQRLARLLYRPETGSASNAKAVAMKRISISGHVGNEAAPAASDVGEAT